VDNTVGAVGFLPKLVPTSLHPIALVKADENGGLVRDANGFCQRCQPSKSIHNMVPTRYGSMYFSF
jgi:solute carrier family 27 (fatty acid transporter), member 1/4